MKEPMNLTFHNVLARQGSSFCNRACLNFQAFALRDMNIVAQEGCHVGQKRRYRCSLCWLNSACTRESIISMRLISRPIIFRFNSKIQRHVCATLQPPCLCPSKGHKHAISIQSSSNLGDTLLQITREWKKAKTWLLARLLIYQTSITSQILDFIHWTVTIFSLDHMAGENQELSCQTFLGKDTVTSTRICTQTFSLSYSKAPNDKTSCLPKLYLTKNNILNNSGHFTQFLSVLFKHLLNHSLVLVSFI